MTPRYPLYTQFVTPPHADRGTGKGRSSGGNTSRVMFYHHGAGVEKRPNHAVRASGLALSGTIAPCLEFECHWRICRC